MPRVPKALVYRAVLDAAVEVAEKGDANSLSQLTSEIERRWVYRAFQHETSALRTLTGELLDLTDRLAARRKRLPAATLPHVDYWRGMFRLGEAMVQMASAEDGFSELRRRGFERGEHVLRVLDTRGTCRTSEIAGFLGISVATCSNALGRLKAAGFVTDVSRGWYALTGKGASAMRQAVESAGLDPMDESWGASLIHWVSEVERVVSAVRGDEAEGVLRAVGGRASTVFLQQPAPAMRTVVRRVLSVLDEHVSAVGAALDDASPSIGVHLEQLAAWRRAGLGPAAQFKLARELDRHGGEAVMNVRMLAIELLGSRAPLVVLEPKKARRKAALLRSLNHCQIGATWAQTSIERELEECATLLEQMALEVFNGPNGELRSRWGSVYPEAAATASRFARIVRQECSFVEARCAVHRAPVRAEAIDSMYQLLSTSPDDRRAVGSQANIEILGSIAAEKPNESPDSARKHESDSFAWELFPA